MDAHKAIAKKVTEIDDAKVVADARAEELQCLKERKTADVNAKLLKAQANIAMKADAAGDSVKAAVVGYEHVSFFPFFISMINSRQLTTVAYHIQRHNRHSFRQNIHMIK